MIDGLKHYWINRDSDFERAAFMNRWLSIRGISNIRVSAVTPDSLPKLLILPGYEHGNSPIELSCLCSHISAIKKAYYDGCDHAVILEDDIISAYICDFSSLQASAPSGWQILQLSVVNEQAIHNAVKSFQTTGEIWQQWDFPSWGAGAYIINRAGMDRVISLFSSAENAAIDLRRVRKHRKLVSDYVLYRYLESYMCTFQMFLPSCSFGSTIHPSHVDNYHTPSTILSKKMHNWIDRYYNKNRRYNPTFIKEKMLFAE